jgi:predicted nuclease with TOPRIM domain
MEQVIKNGAESKAKIIESIASASKEIRIAMAYFTDKDIANQIINAVSRGVDVTVILSADKLNEDIKSFLTSKCKVFTHIPKGGGVMHLKFCIIDKSLLLHGTYNYTYRALNNNEEILNLTDSSVMIGEHLNIFDKLLNELELNVINQKNELIFQPKDNTNYLDDFTDILKNQVLQIFDNFNGDELTKEGNNLSRDSSGSEAVFINYLDSTLAEVNSILNQNDHTKVLVKTRMTSSLDRAIEANSLDLESDLNLLSKYNINLKNQLQIQIDDIKEEKTIKQEKYKNLNTDLSRLGATVTELNDEIDSLDRQIVVRKFWTFPTVLKLILTLAFIIYLSIFFASAIWKIFFEGSEIKKLLTMGITPEAPPLFDANAIMKIFSKKGPFFGWIATFFFILPVALTSIKLIVQNNKFIEILFGWIIGLFAFDVVVSILISKHTFEINSLVIGSTKLWTFGSGIKSPEFWLTFIFGALPLFLTKFLIESIWNAYNRSNPELVDRERFLNRNSLKRKLFETTQEIENLKANIASLNERLEEIQSNISKLENDKREIDVAENNKKFELQERCDKRNKNLRDIYNSFIASVDSGNKLFLHNVVRGRITAFKEGFFLHLTYFYSENIAREKIEKLEMAYKNWEKSNFEN